MLIRSTPLFVLVGCFQGLGSESSGDTATSASPPIQHATCTAPGPGLEPPPPTNCVDRPQFDLWRDLDCTVATARVQTCGATTPCANGGVCMMGRGAIGVCNLAADADIWCDGEGEAMGYLDDQCWLCVAPEVHAAACCVDPAAFDCRAWPYAADGPPGSVCKLHEDCEPGLACGDHRGSGYGICQCPEVDPSSVVPPAHCFGQ